ncbi:hypothetical protein DENSPDRAFT_841994 [Dentipellis sp. KUC8613]|nr:hypothetical protein DENSPDRAFT_841994 [Dentipellis sp. KUC8613]
MSHQRRKISDLGPAEAAELLASLQSFEDKLGDLDVDGSDSEGLESNAGTGLAETLHDSIGRLRDKLTAVTHTPSKPIQATRKISMVSMYLQEDKIPGLVQIGSAPGRQGGDNTMSAGYLKRMVVFARKHGFGSNEAGGNSDVLINLILLRLAVLSELSNIRITSNRSADTLGLVYGNLAEYRLVELPTDNKLPQDTNIHGVHKASIFIVKKDQETDLLPRAALALASHCRNTGVKHMRGAVSSGFKWAFFVWRDSEDGSETEIRYSLPFNVDGGEHGMELVVGLLKHWVDSPLDVDKEYFEGP